MPTTDPAIRDHKAWLGYSQQEVLVVSPAASVDPQVVLDQDALPRQDRFHAATLRDIEDRFHHLERRGPEAQADANAKLKQRGDDEAESIRRVLDDQKRRVLTELGRYDEAQLLLSLDLEKRQLESNRRYWDKWLANVEGDLQREPTRVRKFYEVASHRIEPVGLAYLWPVTG